MSSKTKRIVLLDCKVYEIIARLENWYVTTSRNNHQLFAPTYAIETTTPLIKSMVV